MFQRIGVTSLGVTVLAMLLGIVGIDLWFELKGLRPLGLRVASWSRRYPFFVAGLALVFGAMVGHFFWP